MFKVNFGGVKIFEAPTVEAALAFALEVHRVSNVEHVISVLNNTDDVVVSLVFNKPVKK